MPYHAGGLAAFISAFRPSQMSFASRSPILRFPFSSRPTYWRSSLMASIIEPCLISARSAHSKDEQLT
jgi:hypothetical protein